MPMTVNTPLIGTGVLVADNVAQFAMVTFKIENDSAATWIVEESADNASWGNVANIYRAGGSALGSASSTGKGTHYVYADSNYLRIRVSVAGSADVELIDWQPGMADARTPEWLPNYTPVAAAGASYAAATQLATLAGVASKFYYVNSGTVNQGVKLPVAANAEKSTYTVKNATAVAIVVYPGGAANTFGGYPTLQANGQTTYGSVASVTVPAGSILEVANVGGSPDYLFLSLAASLN